MAKIIIVSHCVLEFWHYSIKILIVSPTGLTIINLKSIWENKENMDKKNCERQLALPENWFYHNTEIVKMVFLGFTLKHKHRPTKQSRNGIGSTICTNLICNRSNKWTDNRIIILKIICG